MLLLQEDNADLLKMPHHKVVCYDDKMQPSSYMTTLPEPARGSELNSSLLLDFISEMTLKQGFICSWGSDEAEEVGALCSAHQLQDPE